MIRPAENGSFAVILDELRPYPGRMGAALRMTLCCIIVVVLAMTLQVPEAALSCYLIFFANRDNAATGIVIALGLIVAASVGIALGVLFLEIASGDAMIRLALIAAFTFGGMYFSVASPVGAIAATVGFVFAFVLTLDDFVPVPELLSRGLSWMWVVVFFPMAALVLVNVLMGTSPLALSRSAIARRLSTAARLLRGDRTARPVAAKLLGEDPAEVGSSLTIGRYLGFGSKRQVESLIAAVPEAQSILAASIDAPPDPALADDLDRLARAVQTSPDPPGPWAPAGGTAVTSPIGEAGARLVRVLSGDPSARSSAPDRPTPPPDTFSNPAYLHFALKTLLAVFVTYSIYTVGGWFEIHTAMITCFYVALGSTGETLHKATLRIIGCLIGAALGMGSIVLLMPHMTDIGHLILLVGAVTFLAAWAANGSSLIEYAGWQMALAFYLCVLHGYGPTFDVAVATDRVMGILIGNVVVAVIFLGLWPVSVSGSIARHLAAGLSDLADTLRSASIAVVDAAVELGEARRLARISIFEPGWLRSRSPIMPRFAAIAEEGEEALPEIARLGMLRERSRFLFGAPHSVKVATQRQEESLAGFLETAADVMVEPGPRDGLRLTQALQKALMSLSRLERLEKLAPKRAAWRRDLLSVIHANRKLLLGFSRTLKVL